MAVTVYGFFGSFCTQKVYLTLAEKGVQATRRHVNIGPPMENYEPWYARINPGLVVPTLDHDGHIVCNSARIIRYIDDHFEGPPLMPDDPEERRAAETWIDRIDKIRIRELTYGSMTGALGRLRDHLIMPRRLKMLRKHKRSAPELAEVYDARIRDVEQWIATMRQPADMARLRADLDTLLADLNGALAESEFVVGKRYSLADMMATVLCTRMKALGLGAELERHTNLVRHYVAMRNRPRFPAEDLAERIPKTKIIAMVAPFALRRLAAAVTLLLLVCGAVYGVATYLAAP